ncbi:MAG TPA: DUF4236 domain-containing protein [Thermoanaerobaculia bacterium]|nr:DUF4236 domain-containing protein [Thermoanaerobaculia bacterium]
MGLSFRRSVRLFPGVRLNFSASGLSTTVGARGASLTIGPRGAHLNVGLPGTGLSYRERCRRRRRLHLAVAARIRPRAQDALTHCRHLRQGRLRQALASCLNPTRYVAPRAMRLPVLV